MTMSDEITNNKTDWKTIQHSMKLEGWDIGDEMLQEIAAEYESKGYASLPEAIMAAAKDSDRPFIEVAKEILEEFERKLK